MAYLGNGWSSDVVTKALGKQKMTHSTVHIEN